MRMLRARLKVGRSGPGALSGQEAIAGSKESEAVTGMVTLFGGIIHSIMEER